MCVMQICRQIDSLRYYNCLYVATGWVMSANVESRRLADWHRENGTTLLEMHETFIFIVKLTSCEQV